MATACRPAGFEDSDDEEGFMFGDEDYSAYNSANPGTGFPRPNNGSQNRVSFGPRGGPKSSGAAFEDFRMAILKGNLQAVQDMLDQGMDVNTQSSSGWSGLMFAGNGAKAAVLKLLLDRGADPNFHKDLYSVLMATCGSTSQTADIVTECVKQLIDKGADVNARDRHHMTPLIYAAREGRMEIIELLLDSGAQIDRQDSRGWTALSWATQRDRWGVVKLLLQRGADKSKKHSDNLTAIDLARGRQEVVWLFEGGPGTPGDGGEMGAGDAVAAKPSSGQGQGAADLKYGDLEVFLFGLDLGEFHSVFLTHHVDFALLLTLSEDDLTNMGLTQVGVRKKILEGVAAVHKRNWESNSLVPIRIKSQVKCADAVAIIANLSKHLRYISSSVTYLKDHLKRDPSFLAASQGGAGPRQLLLHAGDGMKNTATLQRELSLFHSLLSKELAGTDFSPPDAITLKTTQQRKVRFRRLAFTVLGVTSVALLAWKRNYVLENVSSLLNRVQEQYL